MKRSGFGILMALLWCAGVALAGDGTVLGGYATHAPLDAAGRYFVNFYTAPGAAERDMVEQHGATVLRSYTLVPAYAVRVPSQAVIDAIRADGRVHFIEPDNVVHAFGDAQDPEITDTSNDAVPADATQDLVRAWIEQPDAQSVLFTLQMQDLSGVNPATGDGLPINSNWKLYFTLQKPGSTASDQYFVEMEKAETGAPSFSWGYVDGNLATTVGPATAGEIIVSQDLIRIRNANVNFAGAPNGNTGLSPGDVLRAPTAETQRLVGVGGVGGLLVTVDAAPDNGSGRDFTMQSVVAALSLDPSRLDFGSLLLGQTRTLNLAATNNTSNAVVISSAASDQPAFTVAPASATIAAGASQLFQVTFTPTLATFHTGSVSLSHGGAGSPASVSVLGSAYSSTGGEDQPWGLHAVRAPEVWNRTTGQGIKVAVLDTGIDAFHIDLDDRYRGGFNFVTDTPDPVDGHSHGTHCAGTIAAELNGLGVVGVAHNAEIYALKVLSDAGSGFESDILAAVDWSVQNGMNIASMSLGGRVPSTTANNAYEAAFAAGLLVIAAAGNGVEGNGTPAVAFPAGYPAVMAVGAIDINRNRAAFSDFGPLLDVVAPGVDVRSTVPRGFGREARVDHGPTRLDANPFEFSALTPVEGITAAAVNCGLGQVASDFPPQVVGNIALIQRGGLTFADKARAAQDAGAAAVIIYNNAAGNFNGTLGAARDDVRNRDWAPAVSLSQADGQALAAAGTPTITLFHGVSDFAKFGGTSMACPHTAGVAALVLGANPDLTNMQVLEILKSTATDLGVPGQDPEFGFGLVNAVAAVDMAAGSPPVITVVDCGDPALSSSGGWHSVDDARASDGHYCRNVGGRRGAAEAFLEMSYTGTRLDMAIARGQRGGTAEVFIDGTSRGIVDFYLPATDSGKPDHSGTKDLSFGELVSYETPGGGAHTFRLEVVNQGVEPNRNMVYVDHFVVTDGSSTGEGNPTESSSFSAGSVPALADPAHGAVHPVTALGSTTGLTAVLEAPEGVDLDVVLLDPIGNIVGGAATGQPTEVMRWTPETPGTYRFVVLNPTALASPYQLYVVTTESNEETPTLSASGPTDVRFALLGNHPNPFGNRTRVSYSIPRRLPVRLAVYDALGRLVRVLVDRTQEGGEYGAVWDGRGRDGRTVSSGVYLYELRAGEAVARRKMVMTR